MDFNFFHLRLIQPTILLLSAVLFLTPAAFSSQQFFTESSSNNFKLIKDGIDSFIKTADSINDPNRKHDFLLNEAWKIRNSLPSTSLQLSLYVMESAEGSGDRFNLVKSYSFGGVAYRLLGDYNKAIDMFFKGLNLAQQFRIPEQEGYAFINIANLYIYLEFYSQAYENLVAAHSIANRIEDKEMLSYIFLNKGRVLMNIDSLDQAIDKVNASLQLRIETLNISGQADCYKHLGDIYFKKNQLHLAQENFMLAMEKANQIRDKHLIGNILIQQATIYCKGNKHLQAEPLAFQAYRLGQELNSRLIIHDALRVLVNTDMNQRRFETAANRLLLLRQYSDTLFNQQLSEKVMSMEFQIERQKQEAQLDLLKKDQEIQKLKLERQRFINLGLVTLILGLIVSGSLLLFLLKKLRKQNNQLSEQKEELKQINAAKDKMFMVIGHDLRGPVWNLRALIELLRDDFNEKDAANVRENISALTRAVLSVSDLLENLLYWAKSQDGKIVYNPSEVKLKELVIECIEPYKPWAETKKIKLTLDISNPNQPVWADGNMIKTVVRNLLSNAIKYSHASGEIIISLNGSEQTQRFSIKDHGVGMNDVNIRKFRNNEPTESTKGTGSESGSGIGLSLCKEFISRHNAEIKVLSTPGMGTEFYFELPVTGKV